MPSCWRYFAIVRREIFIPSEFKIFSSLELKESKKENLLSKTVEVVFSAIDNTGSVSQVSDAFVETYSGSQLFVRTKFKDYDIIKVVAKISVGEESQELVAIVER